MNPVQKQAQPKRRRLLSILTALCLLLSGSVAVNIATASHASGEVSAPPWWSGACDVNNHPGSYPLGASYNGVQACGPGSYNQGGTDQTVYFFRGAHSEEEWECVELVMRYMYLVYGIAPYGVPNGGKDVVGNYSGTVLTPVNNDGTSANPKLPSPGDVISIGAAPVNPTTGKSPNPYGHTAVVTNVSVDANGNGTLTDMQQNATANGVGTLQISGGKITGTVLGGSVTGWLHNPNGTNTTHPDGSFLSSSNGHVYEMVGGAALQLNQWSDVGGQHTTTAVSQSVVAGMPTVPGNGTFVTDYATGHVYEIVGGSPMLVTGWSAIGGQQPIDAVVADGMLTSMAAQPVDGTFVADYSTSHVYVVAGGALMLITSWSAVGGQHGVNMLDDWAIQHQFRQYPANGVFVVDYATSHVFEIVGGAPLLVTSWSAIGGQQSATVIDDWALQNQFKAYPDDGSYVADYATSHVYVVAGGSLLLITSWSAIGGQRPVAVIDDWAASNQFRAYPADGTYIQGYGSGEEFQANGGTVTRVTTSPLPAATTVDDWAILNQLGGTE